ncbi:hypothetical protein [Vibrio owensii]|uniref:hypothetical protein n=1 Tax=Vibrio owensii TaxID=696485 RepID=UPI0018F1E803|nr:hypothetical protein [Vibrio owensii]
MTNNLFISYNLNSSRQDYLEIIEEIQSLGRWAKVHNSFWFVKSNMSAEEVARKVWAKMDANDSLMVVDSVTNDGYWYNSSPYDISTFILDNWYRHSKN